MLIALLAAGCDSPYSVDEAERPKSFPTAEQFFSYAPDSVGPLLTQAIDTLRKHDSMNPFADLFIQKRGLPVWNKASGFYERGTPVLKVPVRHPQKPKITGVVTIRINDEQPAYDWTPREVKVNGKASKHIETLMWGYEKRVFGKTQTDGGARIQTKPSPASKPGNVMGTMQEGCSKVCIPPYCDEADWECEDDGSSNDPPAFPDPPPPTDPGDDTGNDDDGCYRPGECGGGGSDVGSDNPDNDSPNDNTECEGKAGASNAPFPSLLDPDPGPYPGPSNPPPSCEEENGDSINIITKNPLVKYPEGSNYAEKYPKLTEYLQNKLPTLKHNETIINAIKKYTSLSTDEIASDLQWGQGPIIEIKELDNACPKCDTDTYGMYDDKIADIINIDIDFANQFENLNIGSVLGDAYSFFLGVVVLHEYVHYGENKSGINFPGEEGDAFEINTYGEVVTEGSAAKILYRKRN